MKLTALRRSGDRRRCHAKRWLPAALLGFLCWSAVLPAQQTSTAALREVFDHPPDDARLMMRWWWFGPAVVKSELRREIESMKAAGIGGFEIQPVYPLALDDPPNHLRNLPYLSPEFLDDVRFAADTARAEKMRVSMTLASGWPYGGPHTPVTESAGKLRIAKVVVPADADSVAMPNLGNGEEMLAAFLGEEKNGRPEGATLRQVDFKIAPFRLAVPAHTGDQVAVFFIASHSGQMVKRAAVDADGFVLDHYNQGALDDHLRRVGTPLIEAFGDHPPDSVFSDSLEVYGSDWTSGLLSEFRKRRGYDLAPHLPALLDGSMPESAAIRHDWGETLTELVDEHYLTPINAWAEQHHTRFRSQTYGTPPVMLSSNNLVDLPEGEGPQWRSFSFTRWATSASHLYRRPVTSVEAWTWIHSPAFRATPLDLKAEADLFFLEGANQLVGHGWPYTPPGVAEPGWAFYAAGALNDHNPWWGVMPELTAYLQRVSAVLREGKPANSVAVFLPTDDAWATFTPGHASLTDVMGKYVTPELTRQILDSGHNFDYIDSAAIEKLGVPYPVLLLAHVDSIPLATYKKIEEYAKAGGRVIAAGTPPSHAPGFLEEKTSSAAVRAISHSLFDGPGALGKVAGSDDEIGKLLQEASPAEVVFSPPAPEIGFIRRRFVDGEMVFLANTSNRAIHTQAALGATAEAHPSSAGSQQWWDPMTGLQTAAGTGSVRVDLAPYESRILVRTYSASAPSDAAGAAPAANSQTLIEDLSDGWTVEFPSLEYLRKMDARTSWTEDARTRYYSGIAIYKKDFDLPANAIGKARSYQLSFGEGAPIPDQLREHGTLALLESPVREAAVVFVNGKEAGSVWRPPYMVAIGSFLRAGTNHLEIRVGNLAINTLAGRQLPDYRLLNSRYGERFVPQDMENLHALPAGILQGVRLVAPEMGSGK